MKIKRKFHVLAKQRGRKAVEAGEAKPVVTEGRVPRISRLMALAIKFQQMIDEGVVKDQAELARLGHVTRARMTQIIALANLAPDIQEDLLTLLPHELGRDSQSERRLRSMVTTFDWSKQRKMWASLHAHAGMQR